MDGMDFLTPPTTAESEEIPRIKIGIEGADELVNGGIPAGNTVLVAGPAGSGKTLFALEFLYRGALSGEKGFYLSLEERESAILKTCKQFGWNMEELMAQDMIRIIRYDPYKYENIFDILASNIREMGAKRVVIDSISAMNLYLRDVREIRKCLMDIQDLIFEHQAVAFLTSEIPSDNLRRLSRFDVEEFVCDGIILLYYILAQTEYVRVIIIRKMRRTNHSSKVHPLKITPNGIVVYPHEEVFVTIE